MSNEAIAQLVHWGPPDGLPPGIWIDSRSGEFIPWTVLKPEVESRLLGQLGRYLPVGCTTNVADLYGRKDWIVQIVDNGGEELAHIWFGKDPAASWAWDRLVRVGRPTVDERAIVWQTFARHSDATYRRLPVPPGSSEPARIGLI